MLQQVVVPYIGGSAHRTLPPPVPNAGLWFRRSLLETIGRLFIYSKKSLSVFFCLFIAFYICHFVFLYFSNISRHHLPILHHFFQQDKDAIRSRLYLVVPAEEKQLERASLTSPFGKGGLRGIFLSFEFQTRKYKSLPFEDLSALFGKERKLGCLQRKKIVKRRELRKERIRISPSHFFSTTKISKETKSVSPLVPFWKLRIF